MLHCMHLASKFPQLFFLCAYGIIKIMEQRVFGAIPSPEDKRTIQHEKMLTFGFIPVLQGGYDYAISNIDDQHKVGICTADSLIQNVQKALNKHFSPDFQYLLQKKYVDGNWDEGSAILSALKVGKKYGFLPAELWTYTTELDRLLPYPQYIAKLRAIPSLEIQRLISLCTDHLAGYASVDIDQTSISSALAQSKSGLICRYTAGDSWYTAPDGSISWNADLINPIRKPNNDLSGHAIVMAKFDFTGIPKTIQANTWGVEWCNQGLCDIVFRDYPPTEIWIPYYTLTPEQTVELQAHLAQNQNILITLLQQFISLLRGAVGL